MRERRPASSGEMVACSSMISTVKPGSFFMQPAYEVRTALLKGQKSRRKRANRPIARPRARGARIIWRAWLPRTRRRTFVVSWMPASP